MPPKYHCYWRFLFSFVIVMLLLTIELGLKPHRIVSLQNCGSSLWLIMAQTLTEQPAVPIHFCFNQRKSLHQPASEGGAAFWYRSMCVIFSDKRGSITLMVNKSSHLPCFKIHYTLDCSFYCFSSILFISSGVNSRCTAHCYYFQWAVNNNSLEGFVETVGINRKACLNSKVKDSSTTKNITQRRHG